MSVRYLLTLTENQERERTQLVEDIGRMLRCVD